MLKKLIAFFSKYTTSQVVYPIIEKPLALESASENKLLGAESELSGKILWRRSAKNLIPILNSQICDQKSEPGFKRPQA